MTAVWFIAATAALLLLQSWLHKKIVFLKLEIQRRIIPEALYQGEYAELEITITNHKLYPVVNLGIRQLFPVGLGIVSDTRIRNESRNGYEFHLSILPFQRVHRKYRIEAYKRGYYSFNEEIVLFTSDIFSLEEYCTEKKAPLDITVYPQIGDMHDFLGPSGLLQGDSLVKRWILDDPSTFSGIRPYTGTEELRRINWKATARSGDFKVNLRDFTSDRRVVIFYYLENHDTEIYESREDLQERSIRTAASAAIGLIGNGIPVGLVTNVPVLPAGEQFALLPGCSDSHIGCLLSGFAGMTGYRKAGFEDVLKSLEMDIGADVELLIVPSAYGEELPALLEGIKFQKVGLILPKDSTAAFPEYINVFKYGGERLEA